MRLILCEKEWTVNPDEIGGIIKEMSEEYKEVDLSCCGIKEKSFELYMSPKLWMDLPTDKLVDVYKVADYLYAENDMQTIGKEIARRISVSNYKGIKEILKYFDIL